MSASTVSIAPSPRVPVVPSGRDDGPVAPSRPGRGLPPGRQVVAVSVLALLGSVAGAVHVGHLADAAEKRLRTSRIDVQRLERRARRLGDAEAEATLAVLEEHRDALRVRLLEALDTARLAPGVGPLRHHVEERRPPSGGDPFDRGSPDDDSSDGGSPGRASDAVTLRLTLEGRVAHGAALLDLLGAVHAASRPWPTETRGCRVQRLDASLTLDCAVDILHWSGLDAPSGR